MGMDSTKLQIPVLEPNVFPYKGGEKPVNLFTDTSQSSSSYAGALKQHHCLRHH
ncbi:Diaminopimelate epimerase, partial [Clarias magur]